MLSLFVGQYQGEIAALSAALIWAIASYIYIHLGKKISPMVLNLTKSSIAIAMTLLTIPLIGDTAPQIPASSFLLLFISGAVGIGVGDTAFFASLNDLGARRSLLLESLAPPLTALLALVFLQEALSSTAWAGIALTVVGVAWVVVERTPDSVRQVLHPWRGIGFGLVAAVGQASGSVMSRAALAETTVSPIWSMLIRLTAGVFGVALWMAFRRQPMGEVIALKSPRFLATLVAVAFAGTFLAIWLQQTAFKYTAAGIAQALTATSPLFVIPIAIALREPVSLRAILGVVLAIVGVWLLFGQA